MKPTEKGMVLVGTNENSIALPQSVEHDVLKEIKSVAIERVTERHLKAERERQAVIDRIANAEKQQADYDREYEIEMELYRAEFAGLQNEAMQEYRQALKNYRAKVEALEKINIEKQQRLQAEADSKYAKEVAGFKELTDRHKAEYDAEVQRFLDNLPRYFERLTEWCEAPTTPFISEKMVKYLMENMDEVSAVMAKFFSGRKPSDEEILKYLFNEVVFPKVSKEKIDVKKEIKFYKSNEWLRKREDLSSVGQLADGSIYSDLKELIEFCKQVCNEYYEKVLFYEFEHFDEADADCSIGNILGSYYERICKFENFGSLLNRMIEQEFDNAGFLVFLSRLPGEAKICERRSIGDFRMVTCTVGESKFKVDFSDEKSIKIYIANILEQLSHKKPNPPLPVEEHAAGPEKKNVEKEEVTLEKPKRKEVPLKRPERKAVSPSAERLRMLRSIQDAEDMKKINESEQVPPLTMPDYQGLDTLKEHLHIHMVRTGIQNGFHNAMGDLSTQRRRDFFNEMDQLIFGKEHEVTAQRYLDRYDELPRFGFWGLRESKKKFKRYFDTVGIDGRIEYLYDMGEWIYRNYCLGLLYINKGTDSQKKAGEVMVEMMMILCDSLAQMALEIEAKIGYGDDNSYRLQAIVQGLATLGDDRTLEMEVERAEQFTLDMAVLQESHAEVYRSPEDDFDRRLAETVEGERCSEEVDAPEMNDVIRANALEEGKNGA